MRGWIWLAAVTAAITPAVARDRGVPPATLAGPAVSCIDTTDIQQTHVRSDSVIDFRMRNGRVYRNTLPYACPSLGFDERFAYTLSTNQLCSVDTITVLQSGGMPGPTCGLGTFQPVAIAR